MIRLDIDFKKKQQQYFLVVLQCLETKGAQEGLCLDGQQPGEGDPLRSLHKSLNLKLCLLLWPWQLATQRY